MVFTITALHEGKNYKLGVVRCSSLTSKDSQE